MTDKQLDDIAEPCGEANVVTRDGRTVRYQLSEDRRTLLLTEPHGAGALQTSVSWPNAAEAAKNARAAVAGYFERDLREQTPQLGQSRWTRRVGPVFLTVLGGPPTWWLPRADLRVNGQKKVMVGWLRRAVVVAYVPRSPR